MKKSILFILACVLIQPALASADEGVEGLVVKSSKYSVKQTLDRMESILKDKGVTIALRWSHDAKAKGVGIPLRPTELLMFGNPKLGSHFFTSEQTSGIDLPLKALAWEDEEGNVWLGYNDPDYITERHHIEDRDDIAVKMRAALELFSDFATGNN